MGWQLIYTSASRTLSAGQSGYGAVARSADLRDALVQRLEQLSYYEHGSSGGGVDHTVCAYRILSLRGSTYHVLSRIRDAGLDFTNRTNHLAHHLVFGAEELDRLPSPALIFARWPGWRDSWNEAPRWITDQDWAGLSSLPGSVALPAAAWARLTGDAGRAGALLDRPCVDGCFLSNQCGEAVLLELFAESLELADPRESNPAKRWGIPFTTYLQAQDQTSDFRWRGCLPGSAPWRMAEKSSQPVFEPAQLLVPASEHAVLARQGVGRALRKDPSMPRIEVKPGKGATLKIVHPGAVEDASPQIPQRPAGPARHRSPTPGRGLAGPVLALAAICLLIAAGVLWKRRERSGPVAQAAPPASAAPAGASTSPASPLPGDGLLVQPDLERPRPSPTPVPEPPKAAVDDAIARLDQVPTYFLRHRPAESVALPAIPELELLLKKLFENGAPLASSNVTVHALLNSLDLDRLAQAPRLALSFNEFSKSISATDNSGPLFSIESRAAAGEAVAGPRLTADSRGGKCLLLLFRPSSGKEFEPFRFCLVGVQRPEPIKLSKTLLHEGGLTALECLYPALAGRLNACRLQPQQRWQLRPFAGKLPKDLLDEMRSERFVLPDGLDLSALRGALSNSVARARAQQGKFQEEVAALTAALDEDRSRDVPLGHLFGRPLQDPYATFAGFVSARQGQVAEDQEGFRAYLATLLSNRLDPVQQQKLNAKPRPALEEIPKWLEKIIPTNQIQRLPVNYFPERWNQLQKADRKRQLEVISARLEQETRSDEETIKKIPADLARLPQVSLVLLENGKRLLELIRFTEDKPSP